MAGLGRGPLKEKQGVQAKKINREKKKRQKQLLVGRGGQLAEKLPEMEMEKPPS